MARPRLGLPAKKLSEVRATVARKIPAPEEVVQLLRSMQSTKLWRVRLRCESAAGR